ncbi:MAG: methyl-accepting chemotaxis protein, partial [Gammaproteobacteria bacterium]|nr:methyl-accepting chemotaxis protein [Gammaproteobacteria bacterium]
MKLRDISWSKKILGLSGLYMLGNIFIGVFCAIALYYQISTIQNEVGETRQRVDVATNARLAIVEMGRARSSLIAAQESTDIRRGAIGSIRASAKL